MHRCLQRRKSYSTYAKAYVLPLTIRRNYLSICQLNRIIGTYPRLINELLPLELFDQHYELRNNSKLQLPRIRTETQTESFLHSLTRLWNSPTPNLRDYKSHNAFK